MTPTDCALRLRLTEEATPRIETRTLAEPVVQLEHVQRSKCEADEHRVPTDPETAEVPTMHMQPVLLHIVEHTLDPDPAVIRHLPREGAVLERHPHIRVVRVVQSDGAPAPAVRSAREEVVGTFCGARIDLGLFGHRTRAGAAAGPR